MKKLLISIFGLCSVLTLIGCGWNTPTTEQANTPTDSAPVVADTAENTGTEGDTEEVVVENDGEVVVDVEYTTRLANCMTENWTKMYGTARCSHCDDQRNLFGEWFANVDYTDCDEDRQSCLDAGVRGFPTWIDGEGNSFPGTQTLDRLATISGCEDIQ